MGESKRRFAGIVDGDNVTQGGRLGLADASHVMAHLAHLTERWPVTCALQRKLAVDYMCAYAPHGWGIRFAAMGPDAADQVLLEAADDYLAHDVTDLIVVSGDHAFAALAARARLHVLSYRRCLSRELQAAATTVTHLDDLVTSAAA
jgi:hypothetical protein